MLHLTCDEGQTFLPILAKLVDDYIYSKLAKLPASEARLSRWRISVLTTLSFGVELVPERAWFNKHGLPTPRQFCRVRRGS